MDTYLDTLLNKHIKELKKDKKYIQKETSKIIQEVTNKIIRALIADLNYFNQKLDLICNKIPTKSYLILESYLIQASIQTNLNTKRYRTNNLSDKQKEDLFVSISKTRYMTWSILTILELTPNLPWEKLQDYYAKEIQNQDKNTNTSSHDVLIFYFLDKLEILNAYNKDRSWEIAKKYLEKNVFKKVYLGEKPPELKTILDSINSSIKENDKRFPTTTIIDGTDYRTEVGLYKIDLDTINKMFITSQKNDIQNVIGKINNNKKLYDAFNHLTNKQQAVINLRYNKDLTYEKIAERLGIHLTTVYEHEKSAIKNLKKTLLPDIN